MSRRFVPSLVISLTITIVVGCARDGRSSVRAPADSHQAATLPTLVTIRDDQTIIVNRKPFFPIGLYYASAEMDDPSGKGLDRLKAMGFNAFFTTDRDRASLDRIAARGMYVWYRPPGDLQYEHDKLRNIVSAYRDHPAILFWEHGDEPVLNGGKIEKARVGYQIIKEIDPNHPVLCTQSPNYDRVADFLQWAGVSDVGAFDIYPVPLLRWEAKWAGKEAPPYTIGVMGLMSRKWQTFGGGKPVVTVLQGFSWDPLQYGREGYPSYEQGRFMAYDSVINGAKGLHYFGRVAHEPKPVITAPAESPEAKKTQSDYEKAQALNDWFWSYHGGVIRELSLMSPIFTSRDAVWKFSVEAVNAEMPIGAVEWRVKQTRAGPVMLLVNGSESPMTLSIGNPHLAGQKIYCWGELRTVKADGHGAWVDRVPPLGVRIYSPSSPVAGME